MAGVGKAERKGLSAQRLIQAQLYPLLARNCGRYPVSLNLTFLLYKTQAILAPTPWVPSPL